MYLMRVDIWERGNEGIEEGGGVYDVASTQIITIYYSCRARHAEGRQIERANGSRGDAVWSNLVQEAWWLRERQEKERLILSIKRDILFHLSVREHLQNIEDRCLAERMMEVIGAPRLCWNDCIPKAAYSSLCSISSKENGLCCWLVQSLDTRCECQPQDEEQLPCGWNCMARVKIRCVSACDVQWLWW